MYLDEESGKGKVDGKHNNRLVKGKEGRAILMMERRNRKKEKIDMQVEGTGMHFAAIGGASNK